MGDWGIGVLGNTTHSDLRALMGPPLLALRYPWVGTRSIQQYGCFMPRLLCFNYCLYIRVLDSDRATFVPRYIKPDLKKKKKKGPLVRVLN